MPVKVDWKVNVSTVGTIVFTSLGLLVTGVTRLEQIEARFDQLEIRLAFSDEEIEEIKADFTEAEDDIRVLIRRVESGQELTEARLREQVGVLANVLQDARVAIARMEGGR